MAEETENTSLKGLFQSLAGESVEVWLGEVKSVAPLRIQAVNDDKLVIGPNITYVPQHLTDYTTEVTVNWQTEAASGGSGDAAFASHPHAITGRKKIIVHNALKVGERVHVLSFKRGKQHFVLGREG